MDCIARLYLKKHQMAHCLKTLYLFSEMPPETLPQRMLSNMVVDKTQIQMLSILSHT